MKRTPSGRGLGWRPQKPDPRDALFSAPCHGRLPSHVDLRDQMPPVYDQGELGSCTGNAIAAAVEFERMRQGIDKDTLPSTTPSRLMIYYLERALEGTIPYDAGAEIRDGIKAMASTGACFEDLWPYDIENFNKQPPKPCFEAALKDRAVKYAVVPQLAQQLRGCIAQGFPFVFGFTCFDNLDSDKTARTGILTMPPPHASPIGGHAVLAVGYDDRRRQFIVRNSWGSEWGDKGYFYMPYEYVERRDLASDFWNIQLVSQ